MARSSMAMTMLAGALLCLAGCSGESYSLLMQAARFGDTEGVARIIAQGANVNEKSKLGKTPLIIAASAGHAKIVEVLLERGADIQARDNSGSTPLIAAATAAGDYGAVTKILLDNGADVNAKDNDGATALYIATYFGHRAVVTELLKFKSAISGADLGEALLLASGLGHLDMVKDMLAQGVDVNAKGLHNRTPLNAAVMFGQTEIVRLLVLQGADLTAMDEDGKSPWSIAKERGKEEIINILQQADEQQKSAAVPATSPAPSSPSAANPSPPLP